MPRATSARAPRGVKKPATPSGPSWPADAVERRPVAELTPYARNARTHSEGQVAEIVASIQEWGWTMPVLVDESGQIIAGHGRVLAAQSMGLADVPVMVARGWTEAQRRAYVLADNKLGLNSGWDETLLALELTDLKAMEFDTALTGFADGEVADLFTKEAKKGGLTDPDATPEFVLLDPVSKLGDVWLLGDHRVMCGDSTSAEDVSTLTAGAVAQLLHADPPYGMGKEADGVVNDNLYAAKLDAFQMAWWATFRPHLASNASAYVWGNAPDLWRLWYVGGLGSSERFEFRNEIVWDKKSIPGMASPDMTQYPEASERCLFFQFGPQFLGNINSDDFPPEWEPIRSYFETEATAAGIKQAEIKRVCGCGMFAHWFTRSQFTLMPARHYASLAAAYPGRFTRPWVEIKAAWDRVRGSGRKVINGKLEGMRSYFDNAHDIMRDVWEFPRVTGDERHGHATPKPAAMMERVMQSSLGVGMICLEPFGGSGSTLIGAEMTGRVCYSMELQPQYVDVAVKRWQEFTGEKATLEGDGRSFAQVAAKRGKKLGPSRKETEAIRKAAIDDRRESSSKRGYDAAWRKCRKLFAEKHPVCCTPDCGAPTEEVDHIESVADRPDLKLKWSNLRPLCKPCHSRRTATEQGFAKPKAAEVAGDGQRT